MFNRANVANGGNAPVNGKHGQSQRPPNFMQRSHNGI